ncbi:hypothetical protein [Streptomyces sp. NPDC087300]|uniref:hypothetical protein n=1 Tax=Streptomyces sp. NPDC087300 TaxID=3365780 RepID=UPI003808DB0B
MVYEGYLEFSGVRIVDNALVHKLAADTGLADVLRCDCPEVPADVQWAGQAVGEPPWWDDGVPASRDFLGLHGLEMTGMSRTTRRRTTRPYAHHGSALSRSHAAHREIGVRVLALATSDAGMSYGMSWLAYILEEASTRPDTVAVPSIVDTVRPSCRGGVVRVSAYTCSNAADGASGPDAQGVRTLYQVGHLEGPDEPDTVALGISGVCDPLGCEGQLSELTFTLAAGRPWLYGPPKTLAEQLGFFTPTLWPCQGWTEHVPGVEGNDIDCEKTVADECVQWVPAESGLCAGPASCDKERSNVLQPDQTTGTGTNTHGWATVGGGTLSVVDGRITVTGLPAGGRVAFKHPTLPGWPVLGGHTVTFTTAMPATVAAAVPVLRFLRQDGSVIEEARGTPGENQLEAAAPKEALFMVPQVEFPTAPPATFPVGGAELLAMAPSPPPGAQCDPDPYQPRPVPPATLPVPTDPSACIATMNPASAAVRVHTGSVPENARLSPTIIITTGAKPLRKLSISIYRSTPGGACIPDQLDECDMVAQFGVPWLGAGTVLTMDGRTGTMSKRCPDGSVVDDVVVYNGSGRPLRELPTFSGAEAWCIVALAERGAVTDPMAITATMTVLASPRLEAA